MYVDISGRNLLQVPRIIFLGNGHLCPKAGDVKGEETVASVYVSQERGLVARHWPPAVLVMCSRRRASPGPSSSG